MHVLSPCIARIPCRRSSLLIHNPLATDGGDGRDQVGGGGDAGGVYNDNKAADATTDVWICDDWQAPRYTQSSSVMYIRLLGSRGFKHMLCKLHRAVPWPHQATMEFA